MEKSKVNFISKRCAYYTKNRKSGVVVSNDSKGNLRISFYNEEAKIAKNSHCFIGYAENRIYFEFCCSTDAYKLIEARKGDRRALKTIISKEKSSALNRFVRIAYYSMEYDPECDLYYIELNK